METGHPWYWSLGGIFVRPGLQVEGCFLAPRAISLNLDSNTARTITAPSEWTTAKDTQNNVSTVSLGWTLVGWQVGWNADPLHPASWDFSLSRPLRVTGREHDAVVEDGGDGRVRCRVGRGRWLLGRWGDC